MPKGNRPRFYTTGKDPRETAYEIMGLLAKFNAKQAHMSWDRDGPTAVEFVMDVPGMGDVPVRLEPHVEGLRERLEGISGASSAEAVAWKQLYQLVEAQLEAAENGVREFHEVFLSGIILEGNVTIGEAMKEGGGAIERGMEVLRLNPGD